MLQSFANGRIFGERYGDGPPWILALHGWARSRADFRAVLGGPDGAVGGSTGGPLTGGPLTGGPLTDGPLTGGPLTGGPPTDGPLTDGPLTDGPPTDGLAAGGLSGVAIDLPGFGASPQPPEVWGSRRYAQEVAAVLEDMADHVVVIGHSLGGRVAVHLAAGWPERVQGLVLSGVPLFREGGRSVRPALSYRLVRSASRLHLVSEARLEQARKAHGSADYAAASGVMRGVLVAVVGETYDEVLRQVTCPVELVWGAGDAVVPPRVAKRAHAVLTQSRLLLLPGIGHLVPTEAPAALRAASMRMRT